MAIDRRELFAGAAALMGGLVAPRRLAAGSEAAPLLLSAALDGATNSGVLWSEGTVRAIPLPGRAHAALPAGDGRALFVGRRPGRFAALTDLDTGATRLVAPARGHRFAGHAAIGADGRTLFTTELHEETAAGAVAVREAATGRVRALWDLGGIEPHDLVLTQNGTRLTVALGGIAHAAEIKGPAVNAGRIDSALVDMDAASGRILARHQLGADVRSLSLRHLAVAPDDGTILVGTQDQDRSRMRPLVGVLEPGRGLALMDMPHHDDASFRSYIGSVAVDRSGRFAAATSPKGGLVGVWSLPGGRWIGCTRLSDVCGLAPGAAPGTFWATSGFGDIVHIRAQDSNVAVRAYGRAPLRFDNHLIAV